MKCKNCDAEVELNFCPTCGQKASVGRIDFKALTRDLPSVLFNIDRGLWFNVIQLSRRPGYAIADYLAGKRKDFYHPLSYLLIILATMLILMNLLNVHYYDALQDAHMSPEEAAAWKQYDATQQAWTRYYYLFVPFYLPWMALLYFAWLRFMKQSYNYWECVVISIFVSAQMTVPQILVLIVTYLVNSTAFARTSDLFINVPIVATLYFFQLYQLGHEDLGKALRLALAAGGSVLFNVFVFAAVYSFLELIALF